VVRPQQLGHLVDREPAGGGLGEHPVIGEVTQQPAQRITVGPGPLRQVTDVLDAAGHQVGEPQRGRHPNRHRRHQVHDRGQHPPGRRLDLVGCHPPHRIRRTAARLGRK
jgi:hypothetical protein